jgi:hypothetical protein
LRGIYNATRCLFRSLCYCTPELEFKWTPIWNVDIWWVTHSRRLFLFLFCYKSLPAIYSSCNVHVLEFVKSDGGYYQEAILLMYLFGVLLFMQTVLWQYDAVFVTTCKAITTLKKLSLFNWLGADHAVVALWQTVVIQWHWSLPKAVLFLYLKSRQND